MPSQRRYVHYYHQLLMQRNMRIETVSMLLRYFEFEGVPSFDIAGGSSMVYEELNVVLSIHDICLHFRSLFRRLFG